MILAKNPGKPAPTGNPFNGTYVGTVANQTAGTVEIIVLTIGTNGSISGAQVVEDGGTAIIANDSGTVSPTGSATYTASLNGTTFTTVTGTYTLQVIGTQALITGAATDSAGDTLSISMNQVSIG
jgi:hypothetical protein